MKKSGFILSALALMPIMLIIPQTSYAQDQPYQGGQPEQHKCSAGSAAIAGALIGGLLGGLAGRKRGQGVLIGSAIGAGVASIACVAVNSRVTKTKTNAQVAQEHAVDIESAQVPQLFSYNSSPEQPAFQASQPIVIHDNMNVFIPQNYQNQAVSEVWIITEPGGESKTLPAKIVDNGTGQNGGTLTNEITFNLPSGMRHGVYNVTSQILIGNNVLGRTQTSFTVV